MCRVCCDIVAGHPSRLKVLVEYWFNVGPTSNQHQFNASYLLHFHNYTAAMQCKTKRQYLLTLHVSRYCILNLHCSLLQTFSHVSDWIINCVRSDVSDRPWTDEHNDDHRPLQPAILNVPRPMIDSREIDKNILSKLSNPYGIIQWNNTYMISIPLDVRRQSRWYSRNLHIGNHLIMFIKYTL